ncbi:hypothetical protein [Photorhabdus laumondii]
MFKKLEQVIFDTRDNKSIFSLISLVIPYGFQDASRRQGSESPGA